MSVVVSPAAADVRDALRAHLAADGCTTLVEEFWVPRSNERADLVAIGEAFDAFEIKTARDRLTRLPRQVGRLLELGVVELASKSAESDAHGVVRLYPDGIDGPAVVTWEPVVDWIAGTLLSPQLADVRAKLARTDARERHAFLGVTFTSPGEVFFALDVGERGLPVAAPKLPREITHLWLMRALSPGHV